MPAAIVVENLSKRYRLSHQAAGRPAYRTLREDLVQWAGAPWRWLRGERGRQTEDFWALRDVSFEVQPGEVVGVIGRNGAGKSTLLKVLSRITRPTSGRVRLRGRVGSLLEVGTGFHPELTGRENIYLSGAIMGMRRAEIRRKFDEIVAFAEVEKFLDLPVKRYSSGMYMRLAFAVAAHLDTEILLVDEVLAVGDAAFQKKCLGKMGEVANAGKTVLLVSHNVGLTSLLCSTSAYFELGQLLNVGDTAKVVSEYLRSLRSGTTTYRGRGFSARMVLRGLSDDTERIWEADRDLTIEVTVHCEEPSLRPAVDLAFYTESGTRVISVQSDLLELNARPRIQAQHVYRFCITNPGLACGTLSMDLGIRVPGERIYRGCWEGIDSIAVSLGPRARVSSVEALLAPKCTVANPEAI